MAIRVEASAVKADLNVTPLVDVCLVLLIIFMVVTPMIVNGHSVDLPATSEPSQMPADAEQLVLAVERDGTVFVGDDWVAADRLLPTLRDLHERAPARSVVIKGDQQARYREIRGLMQTLEQAGFGGAGLVTTKKG
jgi:biopolymer transport protein ExbD